MQLDGTDSFDAEGDPLSFAWALTTRPTGSSAVLGNATTASPTFVADVAGEYVAQLIVNDGNEDSAPDTVVISTTNTRPVADAGIDQVVMVGDSVQLDGLQSNDADGDPLTFDWSFTAQPNDSTSNINGPTTSQPTFDADVDGLFVVQLVVNDGLLDSDPDTTVITVQVIPNDAPIANDDDATTDEDTFVDIDVLANDTDGDGDALSIFAVSGAVNGTVGGFGGGLRYTPDADFNGVDSFSYTITDGTEQDTATVTITVNPVNDIPVANDDNDATDEDMAVTVDVLANDTDLDGDTLTIDAVTQGSDGTVVNNGTDVTYTPDANFDGVDTFTYTMGDGNGGSDTATVTITVGGTNDDPVANDDSATTDEDNAITIDVLANDTDADGDALSIDNVTQAANGVVVNNGTDVTYTPDVNFNGPDTFTYTATDGNGGFDTATVTVTVSPVNDDPEANDDVTAASEDVAVTIDVLANDTDVDGDALTVSAVTQGANGTVANNGSDVTYTPNVDVNGQDTFTYTTSDGNGGSDIATVTVNVGAINDAPVANDDTADTDEDNATTINVLTNDTDIDGDGLTVNAVTQGTNGTVANNGADVTYTPNADFEGADTFTYAITDGAEEDTATVTVTVNAINDDPVANDDSDTTDEDQAVTVDVLANDTDIDGDALSVSAVTQPTDGTVVNNGTDVTYTPDADFNGQDTFT